MKIVDRIALILVIIGALNWGSVGLFAFDCVAFICGGQLVYGVSHCYSVILRSVLEPNRKPAPQLQRRRFFSVRSSRSPRRCSGCARGSPIKYPQAQPATLVMRSVISQVRSKKGCSSSMVALHRAA